MLDNQFSDCPKQDLAPKERPGGACELLDAPSWAPLREAGRGTRFSSFAVGFMHGDNWPFPFHQAICTAICN